MHHERDAGIKVSLNVVFHALHQFVLKARNKPPTYYHAPKKPIFSRCNAQLPCHGLETLKVRSFSGIPLSLRNDVTESSRQSTGCSHSESVVCRDAARGKALISAELPLPIEGNLVGCSVKQLLIDRLIPCTFSFVTSCPHMLLCSH